jgi:hypothetical protein
MAQNFNRRSQIHINTLPPLMFENTIDDMVIKDSRGVLDAIKQLVETGIKGPNLYTILATIDNSLIKLKIQDTLIKISQQSTVYLYNDEKGIIRMKKNDK